MRPACWPLFVVTCMLLAWPAHALAPQEVMVVFNDSDLPPPESLEYELACQIVPASEGVARYYAAAHNIPSSNIVGVAGVPFTEYCNQTQYLGNIASPLWNNYLSQPEYAHIRAIVLCYGIPTLEKGTDTFCLTQ